MHIYMYTHTHTQTVDKINAKRNIEAFSRQYVNAKRSAQEYDNLSRGLIRGGTSIPLRGTPQELQQVTLLMGRGVEI